MITVTALGANSATLTYDNTTTLLELIQEVEDYITTHGWSLWDINAGTNARAYRALKQDGVNYQYIVLDWNTSGYVILRAYEYWDRDAHTGLNQAFNLKSFEQISPSGYVVNGVSNNSIVAVEEYFFGQPVDIGDNGSLHIYCQSTYMLIVGVTQSQLGTRQGGSPTMFFEYARDNAEDTPLLNIPSHGMLIGDNLIGGFTNPEINPSSYALHYIPGGYSFAFCRLKNGNTGEDAVIHSWFALPEMFWSSPKSYFRSYTYGTYMGRMRFADPILSIENAWSGKKIASNIFVGFGGGAAFTNPYIPNGRLYNAKMISSDQGSLNDIAQIQIDGEGFYSLGGTLTDHLILPLRDWGNNFDYRLRLAIPA